MSKSTLLQISQRANNGFRTDKFVNLSLVIIKGNPPVTFDLWKIAGIFQGSI